MPKIAIEFDEKKIDAIFAEVDQCHKPGVAVGVAIAGKPVYRKGFGLANMELPVVLSPSIRMRIYSMTKHFACLAYMLLCEDGKAGIDDPVGKHLPELHAVSQKATMRQLMGHISGLRDASDICWQYNGTGLAATTADLVSLYRTIDDMNSESGTTWNYNNGCYLLLSTAIERISGMPFEDVLRQRIFEPAGMFSTMLRRRDTDFIPNSATMHMINSEGAFVKSYLGIMAGEGGIISTVDDMLRWTAHMDAPVVGTAETWKAMKTPLTLANGSSTGYALGLHVEPYRGVDTVQHSGGGMGANSQMVKVPGAGLDIVIMSNRADVSSVTLGNQIIDALLSNLEPVSEPAIGTLASGVFCSPKTGRVLQLGRAEQTTAYMKEGQQLLSIDGMDLPLEPDKDGVLRPASWASSFKLTVMPVGNPTEPASVKITDFGNPDELLRQSGVKSANASAIEGRYHSAGIRTDATIRDTEDGPRMKTVGPFGSVEFRLENLSEGIWRARGQSLMPLGGVLLFEPDGKSYRYSTGRNPGVRFQRSA